MMTTTYWVILGLVVVIPGLISVFFRGFSFDPRSWRKPVPATAHHRRHDDRHNVW